MLCYGKRKKCSYQSSQYEQSKKAYEDFLFSKARGIGNGRTVLYTVCHTTRTFSCLCSLLGFSTFQKSIVFATILCGMVLELLGVWYVLHIGHPELVRPAEFILGPMSALIYFVNVKINPFKLLFTYIVVADYMMIIKALSAVICIRFLHCHPYELWGGIISLAAHILLYPLMYRFFIVPFSRFIALMHLCFGE